ncbi:MAG TPA: BREX-1 system adenine-specific DNA-methyltransferase PglX, partial [Candidatus Hydrogenedentes bacterium]|nr:BREX-1 system adenine-specific DNA-methyltransferase PglX [Candidatus Hydrogenedentota bacterium]
CPLSSSPSSLSPEHLTLLDPACGSGHILVEAYDLFKAIYQERGYRANDIPRIILEKNLFGLEIDDRAAQLATFALLMKARADDRRVLEGGIRMNVHCIQSSEGITAEAVYEALTGVDVVDKSGLAPAEEFDFSEQETAPLLAHLRHEASSSPSPCPLSPVPFSLADIRALLGLFQGEDAKTFGSLLRVPGALAEILPGIIARAQHVARHGDLGQRELAEALLPLARQAVLLARQYDAVIANPPYMGAGGMNPALKAFAKKEYSDSKSDLFAMFMERNLAFARPGGCAALITMQSWMFLSSFEKLREHLLRHATVLAMAHLGPRAFDSISGEVVNTTAFVLLNAGLPACKGAYIRLVEGNSEAEKQTTLKAACGTAVTPARKDTATSPAPTPAAPQAPGFFHVAAEDFRKIPGSPIAYWVSERVREVFETSEPLGTVGSPTHGVVTGDNDRFLRRWSEVSIFQTCFDATNREEAVRSMARWFPVSKGGPFRRWFGNNEFVIDWLNDGHELRTIEHESGRIRATNFNLSRIFQPGITWSTISSSSLSMRYLPAGMIFESKGSVCFSQHEEQRLFLLALTNTHVITQLLLIMSPTLDYHEGPMSRLPIISLETSRPLEIAGTCRTAFRSDWDAYERSWDFQYLPLLTASTDLTPTLASSYTAWITQNRDTIAEMKRLEEENNRLFIDAYGLADELTPEVPIEQITLTVNPAYRYGMGSGDREEGAGDTEQGTGRDELGIPAALWVRFCHDTMAELVSYAVGCMMGRYSLDAPGLIYAHSGNEGFDPGRYRTFPADADGILPLTETEWFADDAASRVVDFIAVAWPREHLEENLAFVAEALGARQGEPPRDTIRRYLAAGFYKDHLQTYKRRPIYWLFSSGKHRAFQCLVYLHRYNEGTLARMRTEYVIPLQGRLTARMDHLADEILQAGSTSHRKKLEKERDGLLKQQAELLAFDEKLHHYADKKIRLDLDDGVKVNYAKFGDLLAEVNAVTGGTAE